MQTCVEERDERIDEYRLQHEYVAWIHNNHAPSTTNIPDTVFFGLWQQMVREGKDKVVFYAGEIASPECFMRYIKSPGVHPVAIVDVNTSEIVLLAWLTGYKHGTAEGHFCPLGNYRRGAGKAVIDFWKGLRTDDGTPLVRVVWGRTPAKYCRVLKLVQMLGFKRGGVIPGSCWLSYENEYTDSVISYITLHDAEG